MVATAVRGEEALVAEEALLARAAASGDGSAFAALYRRYEQRAFNLAFRILGSEANAADAVQEAFIFVMRRLPQPADGGPAFGAELLTATCDACHDMIARRHPAWQREAGPEPWREIQEASLRLPERQREALALRELAQLSYGEIAAIMGVGGDSVAQLISRARINVYDELRGTVLASVAPPSPECERALPLIAARGDGQLEACSDDAAWLDGHLADCDRCRLAVEQIQEADASYRAWAPIAAVPWLLGETMAKAADLAGADWSEEIAEAAAEGQAGSSPAAPPAGEATPRSGRSPRRRLTLALGLAGLLLLAGFAAAALVGGGGSPTSVDPVAGAASERSNAAPESSAKSREDRRRKGGAAKKRAKAKALASSAQTAAGEAQAPVFIPAQATTAGGAPSGTAPGESGPPGKTAVQPSQQTAASKPGAKPKGAPTSNQASQPATESTPAPPPTPPAESAPPAEEAPDKPGRSGEAPGKPADHPSH